MKNGYIIFRNFLSKNEVMQMKSEILTMLESWDPKVSGCHSFTYGKESHKNYFRQSGTNISWFLENGMGSRALLAQSSEEKLRLMNKCGHALHTQNEFFRKFVAMEKFNHIIPRVVRDSQLDVVQSMIISKPPQIGSFVPRHRDDTYVTPVKGSCYAFWIALDDAKQENGCLEVIRGSHKDANIPYSVYSSKKDDMIIVNEESGLDRNLVHLRERDREHKFIKLTAKTGDLIVFHGRLIHRSKPNFTRDHRLAMTLHTIPSEIDLCSDSWLGRFGYERCRLGNPV